MAKLVAYSLLVSVLSLFMYNVDGISNNTTGFSIDIFHRDSPLSPTYNSSLTPDQHLANAVQRSIKRVRQINNHILSESPFTYILLTGGTYLTSFQLGTPPVPILSVVDSGSSFVWTQCEGCNSCFHQDAPYFDPQESSTYTRVSCSSAACQSTYGTYCDLNEKKFCVYSTEYVDGSYSLGRVAKDTVTFHSTDRRLESFPSISFGCGYNNGGVFSGHESGVLGMGAGYGSLITQLDYALKGKFSYCLVSERGTKKSSRLNFGDNAIVSGPGTVSTPLFIMSHQYYSVILDAVSINHMRLEYTSDALNNSKVEDTGNMMIDNGAVVTFLNRVIYDTYINALKNYLRLETVEDPDGHFETCFYAQKGAIQLDTTFHFRGANVAVRAENLFLRRNADIVCFAVIPIDGVSVLGSMAQVNFLVGFDIKAKTVSFKRFDCEQYR